MKKRKNITESSNPNSNDIDVKNIREIIQIFHNDNLEILDGFNKEGTVTSSVPIRDNIY